MKLILLALTLLLSGICLAQDDNPYFQVIINGKSGFIDKKGQITIKPIYEDVASFADGLAPVKIKGKWGFIDKAGKLFIKPRFDQIHQSFYENLASVRVGEKWGFIDKTGKFVIKPNLEFGASFDEGRSIINIGQNSSLRHGVIDKTGKLITEQLFRWSGWSYNEGLLNVKIDTKWGFIDRDAKIIIPAIYEDAKEFCEGLAAVKLGEGKNQWGFIDKNGKIVIPAQFEEGFYFKNGLGAVQTDGQIGFIDHQGKMVINPKFDWTYYFSEGLAAVKVNGKWGFIDTSGKFVVEPKYESVGSFNNGLAEVAVGEWKPGNFCSFIGCLPYLDGKWGYIDTSGKEVWEPTK